MTSDAKIGLLLGLVFIFVIAFIINGLPNFGNHSQAEATSMIDFEAENLGVVDNAQNAQEQLDWTALLEQEDDVMAELEPVAGPETTDVTPDAVVAAETEGVRSEYTLEGLMTGVSRTIEDVVNRFAESSRSTTLQAEASEPTPAVDAHELRPDPTPAAAPAARSTASAERASGRPAPKIYEVQAGDVLATVAKKAYGPEEGNRLVNINRIFEANRMTLDSPDEIFVGQKLVIPALPKAAGGATDTALSEALFEKVQDIGRRNLDKIDQDKPQGRFYVVQDGDSLWRIAATQLGNGARHEEIAKLNADLLKNKDTLAIGMHLRLPAK
ncbi:MAG: LysM peptidoglycan-binding domain-containing protein [Phycisphaerales bacterium]|nr:MAG: LysM peptidoglycan-binding domain-containing protein [Phycisphaerales bacterium]